MQLAVRWGFGAASLFCFLSCLSRLDAAAFGRAATLGIVGAGLMTVGFYRGREWRPRLPPVWEIAAKAGLAPVVGLWWSDWRGEGWVRGGLLFGFGVLFPMWRGATSRSVRSAPS